MDRLQQAPEARAARRSRAKSIGLAGVLQAVAQQREDVGAHDLVALVVVGVQVGLEVARAEARLLARRTVHDLGGGIDAVARAERYAVGLGRALRDRLGGAGRRLEAAGGLGARRPGAAGRRVAIRCARVDALVARALHRPGDEPDRRRDHAAVTALARVLPVDVE